MEESLTIPAVERYYPPREKESSAEVDQSLISLLHHGSSFYYRPPFDLKSGAFHILRLLTQGFTQQAIDLLRSLDHPNDLEKAIHILEDSILHQYHQLNRESLFLIYNELGNLFQKLGDWDTAEDYYHKAFALRPTSAQLLVNLGTLNIQKGEWLLVGHYFKEALRYQSHLDKAWTGLAIYHHYLGELGLAVANLKQALDHNPSHRTALLFLHQWSEKLSPLPSEEVLSYTAKYLYANPWDQEISLLLIRSSVACQNFSLAKIESEKLICLEPHNPIYAQIYFELNEVAHGYT
jgi:tetratricopeptide (TPR) repeat protein